jgi:hypothetical protein
MSRALEALLGGLPGGAQHGGYRGPGRVVLTGADDGCVQSLGGVGELDVGVVEQIKGIKVGVGQPAWCLALAEGAALPVAG